MLCKMCGCYGVASGARCCNGSRVLYSSCRRMRSDGGFHASARRNAAFGPLTRKFNGAQRAGIVALDGEVMNQMLSAVCGPPRQQSMALQVERATAMHSNETLIAHSSLIMRWMQ